MNFPILDAKATGARIKQLRIQKKLRVEDVARFMGFESEQAVYKWQRGDSLPTIDNLYALSFLFETSVDDILRGSRGEDESPLLPVYIGMLYGQLGKDTDFYSGVMVNHMNMRQSIYSSPVGKCINSINR